MDEVKATGVLFNIGSISELERFGKKFPGSDICLRFNPDVKDGDSDKTMTAGDLTKFGILMEEVDKTVEIVKIISSESSDCTNIQDPAYRTSIPFSRA